MRKKGEFVTINPDGSIRSPIEIICCNILIDENGCWIWQKFIGKNGF